MTSIIWVVVSVTLVYIGYTTESFWYTAIGALLTGMWWGIEIAVFYIRNWVREVLIINEAICKAIADLRRELELRDVR